MIYLMDKETLKEKKEDILLHMSKLPFYNKRMKKIIKSQGGKFYQFMTNSKKNMNAIYNIETPTKQRLLQQLEQRKN